MQSGGYGIVEETNLLKKLSTSLHRSDAQAIIRRMRPNAVSGYQNQPCESLVRWVKVIDVN